MIAGAADPDSGRVQLGASLTMGYFAQQSLDVLDPDLTIFEELTKDFPHDSIGALRTLAGAFQFSGDDVDKKIRALSGGEKSRLAMARMIATWLPRCPTCHRSNHRHASRRLPGLPVHPSGP